MTVYWPDNELKEPDDVPEGWDEMMPTENINFNGCDDRCMSSALYEIQYFLLTTTSITPFMIPGFGAHSTQ